MAGKTVDEAIGRINELNDFFLKELLRVETNLVMILLPASLTLLSINDLNPAKIGLFATRLALLAFFGTYLLMLFIELCRTEAKKRATKAAQDALYAIPAAQGSAQLTAFPDENSLFEAAERSIEKGRYSLPTAKLLIAALVALLTVLLTIAIKTWR